MNECYNSDFSNGFNDQKKLITIIVFLVILMSIIAIPLIIIGFDMVNSLLLGSKNPCESLPDIETAKQIVNEHQDVIDAIENIDPNCIFVSLEERCDGKGELVIYYCTIDQQREIIEIIGTKTFFGLPYRMFNT